MKTLYSYVIKNYLLLTTIPFVLFGSLSIAKDIYVQHNSESSQYHRVIAQQQNDAKKALINFDLLEAELVATRISQLDYIVSVTLDSYSYGMKMAEIINSESTKGQTLYYPVFNDKSVQIGQLIVIKDYTAYYTQIIYRAVPHAAVFLAIICAISLLFSRTLTAALKRPFTELQQFAFQIANGDYQTPSKTESKFIELTTIFRALETMRSRLKETISKLKQSEERYSRTYNLTQVCLFVVNTKHGKIVRANHKFTEVMRLIPHHNQASTLQDFIAQLKDCSSQDSFKYSLNVGDKQRYFQVNRSEALNDEIECSALDITELVIAKQAAESQLVTDVLTQVSNRYCFNQFICSANNGDIQDVSVMMIDLNGFKQINDSFGHAAGDHLLVEVAKRIKQHLNPDIETLYRLGGDEFVVTIESDFKRDSIDQLALKIQQSCCAPIYYQNKSFTISLSIGVDHFSQDTHLSIEKCLNSADAAMYQAKTNRCGLVYASDLLSHPF
ncbi:diguanylate cyclase [Vibrio sinaloensis DSM 21326]|uniref:Diguanylate cyclase n=1 Tax=Vibrio sinaloensis DSM 21326 TaxID=945550 RepID=E8M9G9_PHOS4|nr:GGDEF domain-containing protein [Vibrio sinaloensis]EGA69336.1 diguanylate cyclase [Vibrio sinaloensis DSM 21326]